MQCNATDENQNFAHLDYKSFHSCLELFVKACRCRETFVKIPKKSGLTIPYLLDIIV